MYAQATVKPSLHKNAALLASSWTPMTRAMSHGKPFPLFRACPYRRCQPLHVHTLPHTNVAAFSSRHSPILRQGKMPSPLFNTPPPPLLRTRRGRSSPMHSPSSPPARSLNHSRHPKGHHGYKRGLLVTAAAAAAAKLQGLTPASSGGRPSRRRVPRLPLQPRQRRVGRDALGAAAAVEGGGLEAAHHVLTGGGRAKV